MTKGYLVSLGGSDALLVKELRRYTGEKVTIPLGDSPKACSTRRDAFEMVTWFWYTQPEPKKAR